MSAISAIRTARAAGITVVADGSELVLQSIAAPHNQVVEDLRVNKQEVLALIAPAGPDGWSALDWLEYFEERAAIAEYEGGMSRAEAEANAYKCCVVEWMNRTNEGSDANCCRYCGNAGHPQAPLLPLGTEATGHTWLHSHCWPSWIEQRQAEAKAALAAMGIVPGHESEGGGGSEAKPIPAPATFKLPPI